MDTSHIPDHIRHLVQTTNEFSTIPDPREIFTSGGLPGVEYAYVLGQNLGFYTDPRLPEAERWELVKGAAVYRIGPANNVLIICRGRPIDGAATDSGPRQWSIDPELEELLELSAADSEVEG
jgi:hypothetical protein